MINLKLQFFKVKRKILVQKKLSLKGQTMKKKDDKEEKGKTLPIKSITISISIIFVLLVLGFMIIPAYFDKSPFGKLFENEPAPWALDELQEKNLQLTESQQKGRHHYIEYCATCHGPKGKGDGPTSITLKKTLPNFLNPNTKYKNNFDAAGLLKTINYGIPDTEMPAFNYLPNNVKEDIVEFLIYLNATKNYN